MLLALVSLVSVVPATSAAATTPPDDTLLTLPPTGGEQPTTTDNEFLDLERDLSDCVGSALPKPAAVASRRTRATGAHRCSGPCSRVMGLGIAFIGWRIVAGARKKPTPTPGT